MTDNNQDNKNCNDNDNYYGKGPTNSLVRALLTDLYQLTMTYAHWKTGKADDFAVFELFFRKNPFRGGYTVFCGLDECLKLLQTFRFTDEDIGYLKSTDAFSNCEEGFFDYLSGINCNSPSPNSNCNSNSMSRLKVYSVAEGTVVFPRCPLITIEGSLGIGHLLETTLLNLVNYPSLIATNASRMVQRANTIPCIEFGLRRAQGPDGACSASKYSYLGGFVGTSNVMAGKVFGIPIAGTHARKQSISC
jgi:nicotinate phosphoribosyltransferase